MGAGVLDDCNCSVTRRHARWTFLWSMRSVCDVARQVCEDNFTQVGGGSAHAKCVLCPVQNEFCYATNFKMKPGHMVDPANISFTFYCPNPSACPGGNSSNLSSMCAEGYKDKSCANCSTGFAISDSSVLLCTRCPTEEWQQALQWFYVLIKHALPFALAANSALQVQGAEAAWPASKLASQRRCASRYVWLKIF